ncbi:Dabb family protein [Streptomyces tendae]|uniref:Dabb family protein n=1 Tax=Streptomyces tendae TaxID=1932 RepID=UPI0036696315
MSCVNRRPGGSAVIYHSIRFKLKPDADHGQIEDTLEHLRRLGRELSVVRSFVVGQDIGGEFDYGATYVLESVDDYHAYMYAPLHRATDDVGMPLIERMTSFDITDDPDPAVGERIQEIHRARYAGDPALKNMIDQIGSYTGSGVES